MPPPRTASTEPRRAVPVPLLAVVIAVLVEAALLVAVGVFFLVELVVAEPTSTASALAIAALALLLGGCLGLCARGLRAGRRWARAPVMTWQLLLLLAVVPTLLHDRGWAAAGITALSLVTAVGLLLPSVVAATTERGDPPVV